MMVRITTNFGACGGVVVGKRAAPIFKYMTLWGLDRIAAYCRKRGWTYQVIL